MTKKKERTMLSAFSIILILLFGLGILSWILPNAQFVKGEKWIATQWIRRQKLER